MLWLEAGSTEPLPAGYVSMYCLFSDPKAFSPLSVQTACKRPYIALSYVHADAAIRDAGDTGGAYGVAEASSGIWMSFDGVDTWAVQ